MNQENKTGEPVVWNSGTAIGHMKQAEQEALHGAAMDKLRTLIKCLPESPYKEQFRAEIADQAEQIKIMEGLLSRFVNLANNTSTSSGCCCCGDSMENHASQMACGHAPCDSGEYYMSQLIEQTTEVLKKLESSK